MVLSVLIIRKVKNIENKTNSFNLYSILMEVYNIWLQTIGIIVIFLLFFLLIPLLICMKRCLTRPVNNKRINRAKEPLLEKNNDSIDTI